MHIVPPCSLTALYQVVYNPCLPQVESSISLYSVHSFTPLEYFAQLNTSYSSFP